MSEFAKIERHIEDLVTKATDEAFKMLISGAAFRAVYLYVKPSTDTDYGALRAFYDGDERHGWQLVTPQRIDGSWPRSKMRAFIREQSRRAPLLPTTR